MDHVSRSLLRHGTLFANKTKPEEADILKIARNPFCGPGGAGSAMSMPYFYERNALWMQKHGPFDRKSTPHARR
jgi:hypothetical protein